ncbi:hypothetical protein DLAC_03152 [Tieghemostelium lacteum]|uniref:Uncharacterized protein n=1 Tax=Tieghemostelium lacteum TaxID=361077 RepID=A0A152A2W5_TIELA|nr:hypothetical protein DLAC_03152 [Tieghemostelium lacteum]|eukprot:KYR00401.1 hypothetical protein DLAC_03152 [Tieghemostelium lacteum]
MEPFGPSFSEFEEIYNENIKLKESLKEMELKVNQLEKDKEKMKKNLFKAKNIIIEQRNRISSQNIDITHSINNNNNFEEKIEININDLISNNNDNLGDQNLKSTKKSIYSYFFNTSLPLQVQSLSNSPKINNNNNNNNINNIKIENLKIKIKKFKEKKKNWKCNVEKLEKEKVTLEEMNRYYKHKCEILEKTLMRPSPLLKPINSTNVLLSPRLNSSHCQIKFLKSPSPLLKSHKNHFTIDNIIV